MWPIYSSIRSFFSFLNSIQHDNYATSSQTVNSSKSTEYQSQARDETSKRLASQLVNEQLLTLEILGDRDASGALRARLTGNKDKTRWISLSIDNTRFSQHLRPNDLKAPFILCSEGYEVLEDDPGTIFDFATAWFPCEEKIKSSIVDELRNSASMLGTSEHC